MTRLAALGAVILLGAMVLEGQGPETLRVQVRLVSLFVNVTNARGAPVADLNKSNFAISEDGAPQKISIFEKQTSVPLSIVLAIDTSGSTRKDLKPERDAARDFAKAVLGSKDRLALFSFNSDVSEVAPFTNELGDVDRGLSRLGHGPATAFYAAVYLGLQALTTREGRKVLVLISDGGNTVEGTTFEDALKEAQQGSVIIYSLIDVPIEADAGRDTAGEHAMITLSQETGGRAFYVDRAGLAAAFQKVATDLRTQYLLGYYPKAPVRKVNPLERNEGGFHAVKVFLRDVSTGSEDTPHYRSGYYRAAFTP